MPEYYFDKEKFALKETRKWIQWNCKNGSNVIWGSNDKIKITVKQLEDFAVEFLEKYNIEDEKRFFDSFFTKGENK